MVVFKTLKYVSVFMFIATISRAGTFCPVGPDGEATTYIYNFNTGRYDCITQFPGPSGSTVTYVVNPSSNVSATALPSCSTASSALTFNTSNNTYGCNTITGGSGASFFLAITTGPSTTYSNPAISSSSANTNIILNQSQFNLTATNTTDYVSLNTSSITAQGPLPTLLGTVTTGVWSATRLVAGEIPTDVAYTDLDNNWSHAQTSASSWTITGGGLEVLATGTSPAWIAAFSTSSIGTPMVAISTQPAVLPSDYELTLTSAATPIMTFGVQADGHVISSGTTPSMGTCGSNPSVVGTDTAGQITVGAGIVTSCTMNFANAWANSPICIESDNSVSVTADVQSITQTAITFGFSATLGGGTVWYVCFGQKG